MRKSCLVCGFISYIFRDIVCKHGMHDCRRMPQRLHEFRPCYYVFDKIVRRLRWTTKLAIGALSKTDHVRFFFCLYTCFCFRFCFPAEILTFGRLKVSPSEFPSSSSDVHTQIVAHYIMVTLNQRATLTSYYYRRSPNWNIEHDVNPPRSTGEKVFSIPLWSWRTNHMHTAIIIDS